MSSSNPVSVIQEFEILELLGSVKFSIFANKKVLISGATGMVGSWLTTFLTSELLPPNERPSNVTALVHSGYLYNLRPIMNSSILNLITYEELYSSQNLDFDLVIHAASPASPQTFRNLEKLRDINSGFIDFVIKSHKTKPKIIFFSTSEIYGSGASQAIPEENIGTIDTTLSRSMYPLAKKEAESLIIRSSRREGYAFNIFRLFHTFGPGIRLGDGRSFADFIWDVARGTKPVLHSSGNQVRSFLYLLDMVAAVLGTTIQNSIFNLGSQQPITILEFAQLVSKVGGLEGKVEFVGLPESHHTSPNNVLLPDLTHLKATGWHQVVALEDAISRTLNWSKS